MDVVKRLKPGHLMLLTKIAENGQLQVAAGASAMSQPAASRILAEIESQVGAPLFTRHPKGMTPTPLGAVFIRHAQVILEEIDALATEARRTSMGEIGRVRVGAVTGPAVGTLMPAIRQIKRDTPDIEMTIEVGPSTELVRGLVEGRFDFVISRLPPEHDSRDFRLHPARSEVVSLVVHAGHPLEGKPDIGLDELTGFEWVVQDIGSPIRQAVEAAFHGRGLPAPDKITNSSSLLVVLASLENSLAIAPQSEEVANMLMGEALRARVGKLDLAEPISISPCFIIQNRARRLPPAAERLLSAVFEHL